MPAVYPKNFTLCKHLNLLVDIRDWYVLCMLAVMCFGCFAGSGVLNALFNTIKDCRFVVDNDNR